VIIGIGVDLVEVSRVERLVHTWGERALQRLFTQQEQLYASCRARPACHLAARIAAKEATFKALSAHPEARAIAWREMEVVVTDGGAPALVLHGAGARCASELGVKRLWVSLTHTNATAAAVVMAEAGRIE
jgi:holo-[acyl-carrier protein] synthase